MFFPKNGKHCVMCKNILRVIFIPKTDSSKNHFFVAPGQNEWFFLQMVRLQLRFPSWITAISLFAERTCGKQNFLPHPYLLVFNHVLVGNLPSPLSSEHTFWVVPFILHQWKKDNSMGNNWSINHVENTHVSRFIRFMSCGGIFQN